MTKRYEGSPLTEVAQEVLALQAVIETMDAELARYRAALRTIANSPDDGRRARFVAKQAVEGSAHA